MNREVHVRFGGEGQRCPLAYGMLTIAGGIIITFAREILTLITG